jgi:hypothetical protein
MVDIATMESERPPDPQWLAADFLLKAITKEYLSLEKEIGAFVYVVQWGDDGPVKIGSSGKPSLRLQALQVSNWHKLHLRAVVPTYASGLAEELAHKLAAQHNIRAEWFDLGPIEAVEFIMAALTILGERITPLKVMVNNLVVGKGEIVSLRVEEYDSARRVQLRQKLGID